MGASSSSIKSSLVELSDALALAVVQDDVPTVATYLNKMRSRALNAFYHKLERSKFAATPAEIAFSRNNVDILSLFIAFAVQDFGADSLFQLRRWVDRFPRVQDATVIAILKLGVDLDDRVAPFRLPAILCVYGMHSALRYLLTNDARKLTFPDDFFDDVVTTSILRQCARLKDLDRCVFDALPYLDHGEPLHLGDWTDDHTTCLRLLIAHGLDLERPCATFRLREAVFHDGVHVGESESDLVLTPLQKTIVCSFCPPHSNAFVQGYSDESMLKLQCALLECGVNLRVSDVTLYESFIAHIDDTHAHLRRRHVDHLAQLKASKKPSS